MVNIYVGTLSWSCTNDDLMQLFSQHGTVARAQVILDRETGLGQGHFVTTRQDYFDQTGERVGSMLFRILKFRPNSQQAAKPIGGEWRQVRNAQARSGH